MNYKILTTINIILISLICIPYNFISKTSYFSFGPNELLSVGGIKIDTILKYIILIIFIIIFNMFKSYRQTNIYPWVMNSVYDHKNKYIYNYNYWETIYIVNANYLFDNIYGIFGIMLQLSQIDIALIYIFANEIMSIFVTTKYLNDKKFIIDLESPNLIL